MSVQQLRTGVKDQKDLSFTKKFDDFLRDFCVINLESVLNFFILALTLALVIVVLQNVIHIFSILLTSPTKTIIEDILFTLILLELFALFMDYIKKSRIRAERVIEIGIISVVREIFINLFDIQPLDMFAYASIVLVFGIVYYLEKRVDLDRLKLADNKK